MPTFCCVINCGSRGMRDKVSFFSIPTVLNFKHKIRLNELSLIRRQKWISAIKRSDLTETKLKYAYVCSKHFVTGKPAKLEDETDIDWVPSLNMGHDVTSPNDARRLRSGRKRKQVKFEAKEVHSPPHVQVKEEDEMSINEELLPNFFDGLFESQRLFGLTEYWAIHSSEPKSTRSTIELREPRCVVFSQLSTRKGIPVFEKQVVANDQFEIRYFFGNREYNLYLQETFTSLEELSRAINEFAKIKLCPGIEGCVFQEEVEYVRLRARVNDLQRHKDCEIFLTFEEQVCSYCQDLLKHVKRLSEDLVKDGSVLDDYEGNVSDDDDEG